MIHLDKNKAGEIVLRSHAFSSKYTRDFTMFRRKHGAGAEITANSTGIISFTIPYDLAKINKIEVVNCAIADTACFKIYDTPTGAIQLAQGVAPQDVVPSKLLEHYGHSVYLPNGFYCDASEYEADLVKDMVLEIEYVNNNTTRFIAANFTLHELV